MKFKFVLLIIVFGLIYGGLISRLYSLQIAQGENYLKQAAARDQFLQDNNFQRGAIYFTDRHHNLIPAAINKEFSVIFAVPREVAEPEKTAEALAPIINWDKQKLTAVLSKPDDLYEKLEEKISSEQAELVKSLGLKGIHLVFQNFRYYPFGNLASQLIGFVGINEDNSRPAGIYGLEQFYNEQLRENRDLRLTIDLNLQARAEETLANLIKKFGASGGTAIIQQPETGAILALANKPDFDPNKYSQSPVGLFLNPAIKSLYEPGSVLKVITMAAGLDSEKFAPQTVYYDSGSVVLNGKTIENWDKKAYGQATMINVLEHSINTGAVWAERKIGHDTFYDYLIKFGLDEATGVDFSQERSGNLLNLQRKQARDIDFATASFGQGIAITPLELINAFTAIANGGKLMRPFLNAERQSEVVRRAISAETSQVLKTMLVSAVEKAEVAVIPGYRVAGKTGTAQVPDLKNGGYTFDVINTYIGFAPADKPQFVILLKLDKPQGAPLAGLSVVPAFKELAQFILNYYNISPDKL